ncbi:MAG: radical SAM family heme chaperone HemW [Tatlockia sp.]
MLPTSLYIHIPWCIQKCPYCDFNSHKSPSILPEEQYVKALIADLTADLAFFPPRKINTIFIGGGTPSLLSAQSYAYLLNKLQTLLPFADNIEITLEANPGAIEQQRFNDYRSLGINRLSLGIQSFHAPHLKALGRIHDDEQAKKAIATARSAGFDNINLDIMHGLPNQSLAEGLHDLKTALSFQPEHLSWYQLTLEPNTVFYKKPPPLPNEDEIGLLEEEGFAVLKEHGYQRYEISAFCKPEKAARHNLNYWLFGDYYGIGAGAHGKLSTEHAEVVCRTRKQKQPKDYLNTEKPFLAAKEQVSQDSLVFEFMLNLSRLEQVHENTLFTERTGLSFAHLQPQLAQAAREGLIALSGESFEVTPLGRLYTNNLQALFLPD